MKIRIYYEDTDVGGIVYHTNYIKYCERARSELFFANNLSPVIDGCHFAVKSLTSNFISIATLGDIIEVTTKVKEIKGASIILEQNIYKDKNLIFNMSITLVFLSPSEGKIKKIPQETKEFFKQF